MLKPRAKTSITFKQQNVLEMFIVLISAMVLVTNYTRLTIL